jgi:hypothetical protein
VKIVIFLQKTVFRLLVIATAKNEAGSNPESRGDEAIRDRSSLRGTQRRSNPEIHDLPDCFVARNDEETGSDASDVHGDDNHSGKKFFALRRFFAFPGFCPSKTSFLPNSK